MPAALLMGLPFFSGGGFMARIYGKDTRAVVRGAVSDPARAEIALRTLKQGSEDLKPITKQLATVAKAFGKADTAQAAGLDEPTPFLEQASEQRRIAQVEATESGPRP